MKSKKFIIKRRSIFQRLIRLPKMWRLQWNNLEGVPVTDRISFMFNSTLIVLK